MNSDNILEVKSYAFALRIVKLSRYLQDEQKETILSKQILRSGTAVGALISESVYAQSKPDFISKLHIAIKEANETQYWLNLLKDSDYITVKMFESIEPDIIELLKLLTTSLKTAKENNV
ncbi:four helix bundle protein [Candidatus Marinarcus aquaticus]|uniref:Four helix bundle protein n=1 Tax=Candidatus Marinarcus aquaticus TaxID=2044504 RepID=A0A4Q0XT00_9BACT|nr:four helix bundle protein [Candidatus Marinarcus aquaticus]RXJ60687.1 four helix bundle protein [Candidatus Marinarcus aquaticus]